MSIVLAVDPGSQKCGVAVLSAGKVLYKAVVPREGIDRRISGLTAEYCVDRVLLGNGTGSDKLAASLSIPVPLDIVEEAFTTLRAKTRFFREHPPKGLKRLIPRSLLTPDRPYDDHVAVILAEDYLFSHSE